MNSSDAIVMLLREADGGEVSSRILCERLGVSRAAVWKQIEALRADGYEIEACTRRGYRLVRVPDKPCAPEVVPLLTTTRFGRDLRYAAETGSTNRDVAALAQAGAAEGVVVVADQQCEGRGRMARQWFSPPGVNLYFSLLLRPDVELARAASLPLVAGLAVAEAIERIAPEVRPEIKWPNDILCGGKKLCGVLCEMQAETDRVCHVILGLGVNVNLTREMLPDELHARATSLKIIAGRGFSRGAVLATILNALEPLVDRWCADGLEPLLPALRQRDTLFGREIELEQGGRRIAGRADGIFPDGALRLQTPQGAVPIYSGEAHIGSGNG